MAILSPSPFLQFFDPSSRAFLTAGKVYTYLSGTTTPATTYQDAAGATPHANPIILDAVGSANVYLTAGTAYRFVIQKADGTTIDTIDGIVAYDTAGLEALVAAEIASTVIPISGGGTGANNAASARTLLGISYPYDLVVACSDETTNLSTGTNVVRFIAPTTFTLNEVIGSVNTASSSGVVQVDVTKNGVSIFSTQLTIDQGETTSLTAATPPAVGPSGAVISRGDLLAVEIVAAGTGADGLKLYFVGRVAP